MNANKKSQDHFPEPQNLQQIRRARHEKLISMIQQYKRTEDEEERIIRIRNNTLLEIEIRYKRSQVSKNYVFPRELSEQLDQQIEISTTKIIPTYYDLYSQNYNRNSQRELSKHTFHSPGKRIKSLGVRQFESPTKKQTLLLQRIKVSDQNFSPEHQNSLKKIKRSNTQVGKIKLSPIKLPYIQQVKQSLKTESHPQKDPISKLLSIKLLTEQNNINYRSYKKIKPSHRR